MIDSQSYINFKEFVKPELSQRQKEVLSCFNGHPLTLEQVCKVLNRDKNQISGRLTELTKYGYLTKHERTTTSYGTHCWNFLKIK